MIHPIRDFRYYQRFWRESKRGDVFDEIGMDRPTVWEILVTMWKMRHKIPRIFKKYDKLAEQYVADCLTREQEALRLLELEPKYSPDSPWLQKEET